MLAYCLSLWGFVCKYIWLQMQPFITIHPATAGAIAREVAQWRFASQTSVLLAPRSSVQPSLWDSKDD